MDKMSPQLRRAVVLKGKQSHLAFFFVSGNSYVISKLFPTKNMKYAVRRVATYLKGKTSSVESQSN